MNQRRQISTGGCGTFARSFAIIFVAVVVLVGLPVAASAVPTGAEAVSETSQASAASVFVFGLPLGTAVWISCGVIAALAGMVSVSRSGRRMADEAAAVVPLGSPG